MTTPSTTTEAGVTEAEVEAAYRIILADGDAMLTKIQRALEAFAQSRQPSAQGGERVASSGLVEVLRGGRQCDEDGTEIIMSRQACCEAADIIESLATPPATTGMKESLVGDAERAGVEKLVDDFAFEAGKSAIAVLQNVDYRTPDGIIIKQGFNRARAAVLEAFAGASK